MNSLTIFDIPFMLTAILPLIGAGAMGWAGYMLGKRMNIELRIGNKSRLDNFLNVEQRSINSQASPAVIGSQEHRVRVAFSSINIDAAGAEEYYTTIGSLVLGAGFMFVMILIGLPFITSLAGFAAGRMFLSGWVTRSWAKVRLGMEAELPSLLRNIAQNLQITPNVPSAMDEAAKILRSDGYLAPWAKEMTARMHSEGFGAIEPIRQGAAGVSTSLSIAVELIGRVWTTGGGGYTRAFNDAAESLESVLDARVEARAKGAGAQGTVNLLTIMTFVMMGFMLNTDSLSGTTAMPLLQLVYAGISLIVVYGHGQISDTIDNVV